MAKTVKTLRERIYKALGMRPTKGWTASELTEYLSDVENKSVTSTLVKLQDEGCVKKLAKRLSETSNYTSHAYTRA